MQRNVRARYNAYFGRQLVQLVAASAAAAKPLVKYGGMLRTQAEPKTAAVYTAVTPQLAAASAASSGGAGGGCGHASLGLAFYAHMSSPIRRFVDLVNQHAAFGTLDPALAVAPDPKPDAVSGAPLAFNGKRLAEAMEALNRRCSEVARYHAMVDAMELAYITRARPLSFRGKVELAALGEQYNMGGGDGGGGLSLLVHTERRRVRVPLHDSCVGTRVWKRDQRKLHRHAHTDTRPHVLGSHELSAPVCSLRSHCCACALGAHALFSPPGAAHDL